MAHTVQDLCVRIEALEAEKQELQATLDALVCSAEPISAAEDPLTAPSWDIAQHGLQSSQISRYSRQIILPSFGVEAQGRLSRSSVLVVGAGGLGSPACLYLAAAGIGRLGILDRDAVEISNLHRQVIHTEAAVGQHKALSAQAACNATNSSIQVQPHLEGVHPANVLQLISQYDIILDASDNAPTRYLLSDACAVLARPLVSGAAIGTDGQLTVYCYGKQGPCYRCLFPEAPLAQSCARCSDAGVLGPVPGIIGTLQALEAVKLAAKVGSPMAQKLLLFDGLSCSFRTVRLRSRRPDCAACGKAPTITADSLACYDYTAFTGQGFNDHAPPPLELLSPRQRITAARLAELLQIRVSEQGSFWQEKAGQSHSAIKLSGRGQQADAGVDGLSAMDASKQSEEKQYGSRQPLLLDVRPQEQFKIASLPGFVNVPFNADNPVTHLGYVQHVAQLANQQHNTNVEHSQTNGRPEAAQAASGSSQEPAVSMYVVCRRGNDSQRVVQLLSKAGIAGAMDLIGGLQAWSCELDRSFPMY